jgi:hypothetical protein
MPHVRTASPTSNADPSGAPFTVVLEDAGFEHAKTPSFQSLADARRVAKNARACGQKRVSIYDCNNQKVK